MSEIRLERHDGTAVLTLSRPPVNALDIALLVELREAFEQLSADPPQGLVLTGNGPAFCGGVDVKEMGGYDEAQRSAAAAEINAMITLLYGLPTATVAAVAGHAIGAGFVLMLACDARLVADRDLKLGLTEVTAGFSYPACPMEVVKAELDAALRRRLVLSGEIIGPHQALAARIADDVVAVDQLLATARDLARTRAAALAYGAVKSQLRGEVLARMRAIGADPNQRGGLSR